MSSSQLARNVRYALRWMPDRAFIQLNYFARFHRFANLSNPTTYNEKLNWLKLHDRNPVYPTLVDKAAAKDYVRKILGPEYVIPTLGIWERFEEIPFDELPERFVLKCTHDSEGVVLVPDKAAMDRAAAEKKIREALGRNFYYIGREWPYREVQPRIIAEPFLEDRETGELRDYKFFCFGGEPKVMFISSGRSGEGMTCDFYDMDFQHLDLRRDEGMRAKADRGVSPPARGSVRSERQGLLWRADAVYFQRLCAVSPGKMGSDFRGHDHSSTARRRGCISIFS